MSHVLACLDGSASAPAVCDYAAWASLTLNAPLTFLHVLDQRQYPASWDLSGHIGLGSREHLLTELAALDERRSRLALEEGQILLEAACERVMVEGITNPQSKQRHGDLLDSLKEMENRIRLLVLGRRGQSSAAGLDQVGSQLESVIRVMQRPVLVTPTDFQAPQSALIAFDGSPTTCKGVEMLADSPLLRGLAIHLLMIGSATEQQVEQLDRARQTLGSAGLSVQREIRNGEVESTLLAYQAEHGIDLLVMGAYGHSRIRQFLVGSTTTHMLRTATGPLLLLR